MERLRGQEAAHPLRFDAQPETLQPFDGELTRESFMDFMIRSHAGSEGNLSAQVTFLAWHDVQGAPVLDAVRACKEAGGWETLSAAERESFISVFNSVRQHAGKIDAEGLRNGRFFNDNLVQVLAYESMNPHLPDEMAMWDYHTMREMQKRAIAAGRERGSWRDELL